MIFWMQAEIGAVLPQLNAYKRTLQNGKPTAATPTAEQLYGTAKLPFHYNYVDGDLDVTHDNDDQGEHGSHVAGIAICKPVHKDRGWICQRFGSGEGPGRGPGRSAHHHEGLWQKRRRL